MQLWQMLKPQRQRQQNGNIWLQQWHRCSFILVRRLLAVLPVEVMRGCHVRLLFYCAGAIKFLLNRLSVSYFGQGID